MNKDRSTNGVRKLCIVALGAYPLLAGIKTNNIIGPDVHQVVLAKEFTKRGISVSIIAYCEEGDPIENINGIDIIKIKETAYRFRALNVLAKSFQIWEAMWKANTHIYFHAGGIPGIISLFCRLTGRKYIYENASDALVDRKLVTRKIKQFDRSIFSIGTIGYWFDIKLADAIIVQNKYQLIMLKKNFDREGILIKMSLPMKGIDKKANPPIILWVGSMAEVKQPELFVKLAKAVPGARFQMIGGHSGNQEELYNTIKDAAKSTSNLEFLGVVPFNRIDEYFGRASILANTSMFEGFPIAFIQAWMNYVPVVSLNADPDELLCEEGLGFHSKTYRKMVEDIKILLEDEQLCQKMGEKCRQYAEIEHDITKNMIEYFNVLDQVMNS